MIRRSLDAIGLTQRVVPIAGQTRESFTVDETSTGRHIASSSRARRSRR